MSEKILIIEDDLDSLKLIGLLLQRQGYEVIVAMGGTEGLAQAVNEKPALVLLDVMMPDMDGYEVCRRLRNDSRLSSTPVLMFSAKSGADDKAAGFDAGADDYVSKPTHPAELATRVRALLNRGVAAARTTAMQPATGKGIAVLGIRGGSGVTSLAVNLSTALAASKEVVLVDLCLGSGALGMQMGHRQGDGLARLLQLGPEELDPLLVGQQLVQVAESLRLLLGSYQPLEPRSFTPAAQVQRLLELILREADLVILDLGNRGGSGLNSVLIQMDYILVVLPPQRSILTLTVSLVQHLQRVGVDLHRCGVVLMNTTGSPPSLTQRELETKTQLPVLATIPAEPEMSHRALASGRPVMLLEPNSAVADRYRELASLLLSDLFNPMSVR